MKSKIARMLAIFVLMLFLGAPCLAQDVEEITLQTLEESARQQYENNHPETALDIYRQYEVRMLKEGWDVLNVDLLTNQALAAYQAGLYGESLAYLKQLEVFDNSSETLQMKTEVETLIEHQVFQKNPNHAFVRGHSEAFVEWQHTHSLSPAFAQFVLFVVSSLLLLSVGGYLIFRKRNKLMKYIFASLSIFLTLATLQATFYHTHQVASGRVYFGVLLDDAVMYTEPDKTSRVLPKNAFLPGMTVQILSAVPGWVKVKRVDGETGWTELNDCYLLRGVGSQRLPRVDVSDFN